MKIFEFFYSSFIPGNVVGDWRLASDQMGAQEVEDPAEIDEAFNETSVNPGDKAFDAEYVLGNGNVGDDNEVQNEVQNESNTEVIPGVQSLVHGTVEAIMIFQ